MPVFRITYDIVAPDKASAEKHVKYVDKPNAYFKVSKVMGPKPRLKWYLYVDGKLDRNSGWGISKAKAKRWIKQAKANVAWIKNVKMPVYTISTVKG